MDDEPVGPTQTTAPSVGWDTSFTGGSAMPMAVRVSVPRSPFAVKVPPPVRKHFRGADTQLPAAPPQSPSLRQPRCAWPDTTVQFESFGPAVHSPTPGVALSAQSKWLFGKPKSVVLSLQPLGFVGSPTLPQA